MIKIAFQDDTSASWSNACIGRQGSFKTIYMTVTESFHTAVFWAANTTAGVGMGTVKREKKEKSRTYIIHSDLMHVSPGWHCLLVPSKTLTNDV